jgi:hypothetical protein
MACLRDGAGSIVRWTSRRRLHQRIQEAPAYQGIRRRCGKNVKEIDTPFGHRSDIVRQQFIPLRRRRPRAPVESAFCPI